MRTAVRRTARRSARRRSRGGDRLGACPARASTACEPAYLRRSQTTCPAGSQVVDPDRPDPDPDEPLDRSTDRAEHPAQLPFPALGEDRAIPDEGAGRRIEELDEPRGLELGRRAQAGERRPTLPRARCPRFSSPTCSEVSGAAESDRVLALDAVARMEDPVGPAAVVGQDEQALGVLVEAADRVEPRAFGDERGREQLEHGPRGVTVADRGRHAGRLVEQQVVRAPTPRRWPGRRPR